MKRVGGVVEVELPKNAPVAVVGDTHGDYVTFKRILRKAEESGVISKGLLIALGDYVDRGAPEEQVLLVYELAELKKEMRERLILLRGNHEPPPGLIPYPHDYPWVLKELYGYEEGEGLYSISREVFDSMPHALIVKNVALLVHGGLPTRFGALSALEYLAHDRRVDVLEEILWNDPSEHVEWRAPSPRGAGYLWGRRVTDEALRLLGVKFVVRGHEPVYDGFKVSHGGRVLTVFSRLGPPYYNGRAAFLECLGELFAEKPLDCLRLLEYDYGELSS